MSESPQYEAFRAFARAEIRAAQLELRADLAKELRAELKIVEGPPGKNGTDGTNGKDGKDGLDGKPGERGTDGMLTREEMQGEIEKRVAEINVRTFADIYKGVYKPDELYTRGVLTTWGGSLWLSLVDTKKKPGENGDWKLVVKK